MTRVPASSIAVNIFSANYVYHLPFFAKSQGLVKSIAGGWEIAGTFIDESGLIAGQNQGPGLSLGYNPIGLGLGGSNIANRPNVNGKVHYPKTFNTWFDINQFSAPTPSWLGGPNLGFGIGGQGLDHWSGPRQLHHLALQVVLHDRTDAHRASLRVVQHLQPH